MKRVAILVLTTALATSPASAASLGVGVFGGASIPVVQDDNGTGSQYGVRVPISVVPLLSVEPYFAHSALGDASQTFGGFEYTRSGFDVNTFGLNVALGGFGLVPGFPLFPYAGIGTSKLTREGGEDISETNYNFGLGLGFSLPPGLALSVRGEVNVVANAETSRKFANVNVGVAYKFLNLP